MKLIIEQIDERNFVTKLVDKQGEEIARTKVLALEKAEEAVRAFKRVTNYTKVERRLFPK